MERLNFFVSSIIEHTLIHKYYRFPCYISRLTHRIFEFWLFAHACISILLHKKKQIQFLTNFEVHPQATRKHTNKITTAIVSYSFVTYPRSARVIFFDLIGFWLQRKMLHISGLFLLPCCYKKLFSDKYLFSSTFNLFPFS